MGTHPDVVIDDIQRAIERGTLHRVARQRLQPVIALAHVCRLAVKMDPDLALGEKHQPQVRCGTTPRPRSRRRSKRDLPSDSVPRSTNVGATSCALTEDNAARSTVGASTS